MTITTIFTVVCTADRRSDTCLADVGATKRLINFDDWKPICLQCEHCTIKLTKRGKEIDRDFIRRAESPLKQTDPAVLVCDEKGDFVVSLLSGHMGGANELARLLAEISGGQAVITTASDVLDHTAIDLWAVDMGLVVRDRKKLTKAMGCLVNDGMVSLYSDFDLPEIPDDFKPAGSPDTADLVITCKTDLAVRGLVLHPKALVAGIGCNRGATEQQISEALSQTCAANNIALESIRNLASADAKKDEQGLIDFGRSQGYEIDFFAPDQLNSVKNITVSPAAMKALGVRGVAEPAAILSAKSPKLIIRKTKWTDVTIAVAQVVSPWSEPAPVPRIT